MKNKLTQYFKTKEYFGHPAGLFVLFFTEMWERFSFYGMRALLILYMTKYLLFEPGRAAEVFGYNQLEFFLKSLFGTMNIQQMSSQIYGLYTGFVYFTPFFGGIIADKLWGQHKTVYLGGLLMAIGHFLMASERFFLVALLFLILGNGAFKPNISTQVANLYKADDPRRDSAFTIFYMGINLGAVFSPLVCGTLGQLVGWHWGFGAAGIGMLVGLFVYWLGSDLIPKDHLEEEKHAKTNLKKEDKAFTPSEWYAIGALIFLCILNIMFWAIYEQQGNVLQIWADEKINWTILGFHIPSTWYQVFNPVFIFLSAPILAKFWIKRAQKGKGSSSVTKMGFGSILFGLGYILMIFATRALPEGTRGSMMWLITTTFIFTLGELYLSPIGLSLVTKVSPKKIVSTMMGVWFFSSAIGNYLSAYLGTYYSIMKPDDFFMMLAAIGLVTGLLFYLSRAFLERIIGKGI